MRLLGYLAASVSGKQHELSYLAKKGAAIFSKSNDIYRNLALEQWIYEKVDFDPGSPGLLLMWANSSAVVIGRHQNPWVECSLSNASRFGVDVARRNSGGGTVYHDAGNLNCCFMGHERDYDRKANLRLVCDSLRTCWGVNASITSRDDVLVQDAFKISGTASKIGHQKAYHHFTLLVDVNTTTLHQVLGGRCEHIDSKATSSVKASVKNLKELCPRMTVESLAESVGLAHQARLSHDRGHQIHTVDPSEEDFPGIDATCAHLQSWDWVFGMTPRFTISGSFQLPPKIASGLDLGDALSGSNAAVMRLSVTCYHGKVTGVRCVPMLSETGLQEVLDTALLGVRFVRWDLEDAFRKMLRVSTGGNPVLGFIGRCVLTLVANAQR
uniref:Putative lipoate-protein ligase a n=1 Tax=Ixodes ricinus TaxID=34613 RepID=A0A131XZQ0_IXORI